MVGSGVCPCVPGGEGRGGEGRVFRPVRIRRRRWAAIWLAEARARGYQIGGCRVVWPPELGKEIHRRRIFFSRYSVFPLVFLNIV
jgi:hypothetical protein